MHLHEGDNHLHPSKGMDGCAAPTSGYEIIVGATLSGLLPVSRQVSRWRHRLLHPAVSILLVHLSFFPFVNLHGSMCIIWLMKFSFICLE
jgi:hypothetical protein